jgi:hypothetical protein
MLKIREEQYEELGKISLKSFEDSMVEHIKEFFPEQYEILGEPAIRRVIQYGVERAENYEFITERDVCLYINSMIMLGSNFDTDLQLPWAADILKDESITDSVARVDALCEKTLEYLDRVAGTNEGYYKRALLSVREVPIQDFSQSVTGGVEPRIIGQLQKIWPKKCEDLGERAVRQLIRHALESAKEYSITNDRGIMVYAGLMFMLGGGFDKDPQFPWAALVLNDESITNEPAKVDRLYKEAMAFLEKCLSWRPKAEG